MQAIRTWFFVALLLIPAMNIHALDLIQPQTDPDSPYEVLSYGPTQITVKVNGETFIIESSFSMPNGSWNTSTFPYSSGYFNHSRTVEQRKGYIHITDTFTNLTGTPLPIMQRHTSNLMGRVQKAWCGGYAMALNNDLTVSDSENPTSYAITGNAGIGFMPLNDEFQVHVGNYWLSNGDLGLADNNCVIPSAGSPGSTYSTEWVIVPTQRPDYWDFVNACRRIRNVNFTLYNMFMILSPTNGLSDGSMKNIISKKSANVVSASLSKIDDPLNKYNGVFAFGTLFQQLDLKVYADHNDRVRRLVPGAKTLVYFNSYLDASDPADLTAYQDDRTMLRNSDGTLTQATYGAGGPLIFYPTDGNNWGKAMEANLNSIFGACKADGVFWDILNWGTRAAKYTYDISRGWDGISGDIDAYGRLISYKSSTILLGKNWIVTQIKKIMQQGTLVSGPPHIRSLYDLHFQGVTETAVPTKPRFAILYSPVVLGDHNTENNVIDAHRGMINALNYGCLYNWYKINLVPPYETLTKYMFPITPIELHEGYIIGKERIVTNRSGTYGWGDNSAHEVHVFGADGREVSNVQAPIRATRNINGKIYTELQLAEGWAAAIIRHPPAIPWLNLLLGN